VARFYVSAKRTDALFQYVEADDSTDACAQALANPNGWVPNSLEGYPTWELRAREVPEPKSLFIGDVANPQVDHSTGEMTEVGDDPPEIDYVDLAARTYQAYIEKVDANWASNHPSWYRLPRPAKRTWITAVEIVDQLLKENT
jgi:hypothetical protein